MRIRKCSIPSSEKKNYFLIKRKATFVVQHISFTSDSYKVAYDTLVKHFKMIDNLLKNI